MATKAELELELADLKRQFAERKELEPTAETLDDDKAEMTVSDNEDSEIDWEAELGELVDQLDDLTHKKPLLFALGAFAIGYLLGRSK